MTHHFIYGPLSLPAEPGQATSGDLDLDSAGDGAAVKMIAPKDGSVTKVGFNIDAIIGSPPAYKVGLCDMEADGDPDLTADTGGSAPYIWTPAAESGWTWFTLATPATVSQGDYCWVYMIPNGTTPDASNSVDLYWHTPMLDVYLHHGAYTTNGGSTWITADNAQPGAIEYSDGQCYGLAIDGIMKQYDFDINGTPDEVGAKFQVPFACDLIGVLWVGAMDDGVVFDITVYDSVDTDLGGVTGFNEEDAQITVNRAAFIMFPDDIALTADTDYRVAIISQGTNNVNMNAWEFTGTDEKDGSFPAADKFQVTYRTDAGSWTDESLELPFIALVLRDVTAAGGSSGGAFAYGG